jgi:hypothetical protein
MPVTTSDKWDVRNVLVSLVIVLILSLQISVTLRLYRASGYLPALSPLGLLKAPLTYPIITYPMYREPHFEGDKIQRFRLAGVLRDGTLVPLTAEDLNVDFWLFHRGVASAVRAGDREKVAQYVSVFEGKTGKIVTEVRLENRPLILDRSGANEGPLEIVASVGLKAAE